jgi:hypothetical protein
MANPHSSGIAPRAREVSVAEISSARSGRKTGRVLLLRDISERRRAEEKREKRIGELREPLINAKKLSGLLPICASCKKIRDDKGYWHQFETYMKEHAEAEFSHGIYPECEAKLYRDLNRDASGAARPFTVDAAKRRATLFSLCWPPMRRRFKALHVDPFLSPKFQRQLAAIV